PRAGRRCWPWRMAASCACTAAARAASPSTSSTGRAGTATTTRTSINTRAAWPRARRSLGATCSASWGPPGTLRRTRPTCISRSTKSRIRSAPGGAGRSIRIRSGADAALRCLGRFAALGTEENHPHGQIVAEVFEPMLRPRGHEHEVSGPELIPLAVVEQDASSADDHVDLVLRVRRLLVGSNGARELDLERAAIPQAGGVLSGGSRNPRSSVSETEHPAAIWQTHSWNI